jgi:hypothetical protein
MTKNDKIVIIMLWKWENKGKTLGVYSRWRGHILITLIN